ncbi:unnamed protein product [Allacma fusca]|uniref:Peptidase M14 domain-containing protein n=1 Tax=Allacma fusca TaxID=39272 RepID=A0A8J2K1E9_9HEXA|nr:unnamed protein product [Allacma fusca]
MVAIPAVSPYFLPTFACLFATYNDGVRNYEGYQVLRVNISSNPVMEAIQSIFIQDEFDFWSVPSLNAPTDILVSPQQLRNFERTLDLMGVAYEVFIENVESVIEHERQHSRSDGFDMDWNSYQRLQTIHWWMDAMAQKYPAFVSVETVGMSTEKRPLKVMKISTAGPNSTRPAIWIDGGIHAREWISPATTTCMANNLITEATRIRRQRFVETFDWYFAPVLNPDGYEYTWSSDRLWRKTRSSPKKGIWDGLFGCCKGVDPNRNWAYKWGGKGTSQNQCSQVYAGPSPASEPEVAHIQNYILARKDSIKLFLTFHSYSQLLLLPWGYDTPRVPDHDDLLQVGNRALAKLRAVYGTEYKAGDTAEILYPAAGGSHDWAKGVAGIKYSYCYELRDKGRYGFVLPADQIIPSCKETFQGVKSMAEDIAAIYRLTPRISNGDDLFPIDPIKSVP